MISKYMNEFGPYGAIDVIGAPSAGVTDSTKGMMAEVRKLEKMMKLEEVSVHCAESGLFRRRDFTGRSTVLLSAVPEV